MSRIEKSAAIILKRSEFSETSLVVTMLSRSAGKITCLAKGARRPRSPLEGALEPMTLAETVVYLKNPPAMHILSQAVTEQRWRNLRSDLKRFYRAHYFAELLLWATPADMPESGLFDAAVEAFSMLDEKGKIESVTFSFESSVLRHSGHLPMTQECAACRKKWKQGETAVFSPITGGGVCRTCAAEKRISGSAISAVALLMIGRIAAGEIPKVERVGLPPKTLKDMRRILDETYRYLFDAYPRTRKYFMP